MEIVHHWPDFVLKWEIFGRNAPKLICGQANLTDIWRSRLMNDAAKVLIMTLFPIVLVMLQHERGDQGRWRGRNVPISFYFLKIQSQVWRERWMFDHCNQHIRLYFKCKFCWFSLICWINIEFYWNDLLWLFWCLKAFGNKFSSGRSNLI